MNRPPLTPAVLVLIDRDSRLCIMQDEGVQVVLVDERADPDIVVLLPRTNQAQQLLERIVDKYPASAANDIGGAAVNALTQLYRRRIIVGTLASTEQS